MIKKCAILLILGIFFTTQTGEAQDIDLYHKTKNENFDFPGRPSGMSFDEYELLSTQVRMQDIFAASIVPGYIHFVIKEKKKAWYLVGLRTLGYSGALYLSLRNKSILNILFNPLAKYSDKNYTADSIVAYISAILISGSFLYDWIHGRYLLKHKQNKIRFKYSPVLGMTRNPLLPGKTQVSFGIQVNF